MARYVSAEATSNILILTTGQRAYPKIVNYQQIMNEKVNVHGLHDEENAIPLVPIEGVRTTLTSKDTHDALRNLNVPAIEQLSSFGLMLIGIDQESRFFTSRRWTDVCGYPLMEFGDQLRRCQNLEDYMLYEFPSVVSGHKLTFQKDTRIYFVEHRVGGKFRIHAIFMRGTRFNKWYDPGNKVDCSVYGLNRGVLCEDGLYNSHGRYGIIEHGAPQIKIIEGGAEQSFIPAMENALKHIGRVGRNPLPQRGVSTFRSCETYKSVLAGVRSATNIFLHARNPRVADRVEKTLRLTDKITRAGDTDDEVEKGFTRSTLTRDGS